MKYRGQESNTSRISSLLREEIISGRLKEGDKFSSIRELAKRFAVSSQVLVSVFKILAEEKLVVSRPKSGYFVANKLPAGLHRKRLAVGFLNWKMPLNESFPLRCFCTLIRQAGKYDIQILLNSGEQAIPLQNWVEECRPDAIIVTGQVDDALVENLHTFKIPFMVLGNYLLKEPVNVLETALSSDVKNKLASLQKKRIFRHFAAVLRQEVRGSLNVKEGIIAGAIEAGKEEKDCIFEFREDNDGYRGLENILKKHPLGKEDLLFLSPDYFSGVARYYFEQMIPAEERPFILVDMPESEYLPYPEMIGSFLYGKNDPLAEYALECMLDIYYGRTALPRKFLVSGSGRVSL